MPLLRRRGNAASDNDMRRRSLFPSMTATDVPRTPMPATTEQTDDSHDNERNSSTVDDEIEIDNGQPDQPDPIVESQQSRASTTSRPDTPPIQEQNSKHRRFSVLRFRNASDSQLSLRAKQQAESPPPVPRPPQIITTAPTNDIAVPKKKPSRISLAAKFRRSSDLPRDLPADVPPHNPAKRMFRKSFTDDRSRPSLATLEEPVPSLPKVSNAGSGTAVASSSSTPLAPINRQSESSRSDASSIEPTAARAGPATTPKKSTSSSTPFFKLRRSKKPPEPLFPLSHLPQKDSTPPAGSSSHSLGTASTPRPTSVHSGRLSRSGTGRGDDALRAQQSPAAALFAPAGTHSGHSSPTRAAALRGRSSTLSSIGRNSTDDHLLPPTTRTSSSTGRKSFGDIFGLTRLRQNSELSRQGSMTPATPGSTGSKNNSLQLSRDSITLPDRLEDESAAKYLARVEEVVSRDLLAANLSKGADPFSIAVLRSYMRSFAFFGEPMDMALRKLLMEAELPKETQHIDRCLQAFSNRYHECNPGIYSSPDQAYFLAFSLLILHTDVFNRNNKNKMQKPEYIKNTRGEGIFDDILDCFYDNICYTPFIHLDDDADPSGNPLGGGKSKRKQLIAAAGVADPARRAAKEPLDPYTLILDGNLDALRPNLKDTMELEDHYNYLGTAECLNLKDLQKTFFKNGVLQIVSARSRPDAFLSERTATNPQDAAQGIVDIKVTKVGLLWRKDAKKRKTRSPWQEWGAILTGAQLYLFRNVSWIKNLMHQHETHNKAGDDGIPVIFRPPLEEFKPDAFISTKDAVALVDSTYKRHKNAFVYVTQGGLDEVLLADNEEELNDWLAKLNYAAAFRTSGVKMRGVLGGNYDGQGRRGLRRLDNSDGMQLVQTPTGPVTIATSRIDQKMADDIQVARRDIMMQKITEADEKIAAIQTRLDEQLRNARNLHILAPIQPRTREQLLSSAARMAAQLRWTRTEIWRERCHRDILSQDLDLDAKGLDSTNTTPAKQRVDNAEPPQFPTQKSTIGRQDTKSTYRSTSERRLQRPAQLRLGSKPDSAAELHESSSPQDEVFQTPPQSASQLRPLSQDLSQLASDDVGSERRGSASSRAASHVQSPTRTPQANFSDAAQRPSEDRDPDDVDAEERAYLKEAGLLEKGSGSVRKTNAAASGSGPEHSSAGEQERTDRSKIRRSLHRTLREGAGQLSHHRSRRGRESGGASVQDDAVPESTLARGTGSFVVHGKKASVIQLGGDLQSMSQDEKLRVRKQQQHSQQHSDQQQGEPAASPITGGAEEDDFHSAIDEPADQSRAPSEHRGSTASASTATARSFRELHRKYSSAQAARSASAGARLVIPSSDADSEAAVSFSDGQRSPLRPMEDESVDEQGDRGSVQLDHSSALQSGSVQDRSVDQQDGGDDDDDDSSSGDESSNARSRISSRPATAVRA